MRRTADADTGELMTPAEMREALQLSDSTLAQWRWMRKGPPWVKVGRHVRYPRAGYLAWLAAGADTPNRR